MRRRTLLAAAVSGPILGTAGAWLAPASATAEPSRTPGAATSGDPGTEPTLLGSPITDVNLIGAQVFTRSDGVPLLCGVTTGAPAKVSALDARTGEALFTTPLPGAGGSYAVAVGDDGAVHVAAYSNGRLYRVDPHTGTVTDLGEPVPGETFLFGLVNGGDGRLYGVSYPGTKVYSYEVATGAVRDYGAVAGDTNYARAVATHGGAVYVGTSRGAHLLRLDPVTGDLRELPLPEGLRPGDTARSVWEIDAVGDRLYVRIGEDIKHSPLSVFDPDTETWGATLDNVAGLHLPAPGPDGGVYVMHDNELTAWHPDSGGVRGTGLVYPGRVWNYRGAGWVELDDPDWPGPTLTGWFWRGEMWRYNPRTGRHAITANSTVPGEPADLLSLATARDATVLAGGYLAGFARVHPGDATVDFHRFGQTESLLDDGESVWIGSYPDARGYRYDPERPWHSPEYSPGPPGTAENPVKVWDLRGNADPQDRVFAISRVGEYVVAATGPRSPTFGGALVVHGTHTGGYRVPDVGLGDLTACDLAALGNVVYLGTWIYGGSGAPEPARDEGEVLAYDLADDRVVWRSRPVPGATGYASIVADRDGRLWTIGDTVLAEIDPADGSALRTVALGDRVGGGRTFPHSMSLLREDPHGPFLYAKSSGRLWRVWTRTAAVEDLGVSGYGLFTVLPDSTLALARSHQLFHWRPPAPDTTPPQVSITTEDSPDGRHTSVLLRADDRGGSGIWRLSYRINRGPWTDYAGPVPLPRPGLHRVDATAVDGAGNRHHASRRILARPRP